MASNPAGREKEEVAPAEAEAATQEIIMLSACTFYWLRLEAA